jgi:hypothetical protein
MRAERKSHLKHAHSPDGPAKLIRQELGFEFTTFFDYAVGPGRVFSDRVVFSRSPTRRRFDHLLIKWLVLEYFRQPPATRLYQENRMMLYLGIDLHRKQMTVSLRNESGDVLLRRQVSTRSSKVEEFRAVKAFGVKGSLSRIRKKSALKPRRSWSKRAASPVTPETWQRVQELLHNNHSKVHHARPAVVSVALEQWLPRYWPTIPSAFDDSQ